MIKLLNKAYRTTLLIFLRKELIDAEISKQVAQGDLQKANLGGQISVLEKVIDRIE